MHTITRRTALATTALAGTSLLLGADDKPKVPYTEADERKRILEAGLNEAEADCWVQVAKAAKLFFELPVLHPLDASEVATAIHVIQHKLLGRPTYRNYLALAKPAPKK